MQIGTLNKRITLQYPTRVPDTMGGATVTWSDSGTVFAAIWPISANEQVQAMQEKMTITHRIRIWYRSSIRPSWRIKYGLKYYNIVSIINPDMANKYLDILCKEAV